MNGGKRVVVGLLWLSLSLAGYNQPDRYLNFEHIRPDPDNASGIHAIAQDQAGFLWVGTRQGLYRYDGYLFRKYIHDDNRDPSLSSSVITSVFCDRRGNLWVGTVAGLDLYDRDYDAFRGIPLLSGGDRETAGVAVFSICDDRAGNIWIGTNQGIERLVPGPRGFDRHAVRIDPGKGEGDTLLIRAVFSSAGGELFAGGSSASPPYRVRFLKYSREIGAFRVQPLVYRGRPLSGTVLRLYEDRDNRIWIATSRGLFLFDPRKAEIQNAWFEGNAPGSLLSTGINAVREFDGRRLWIGTMRGLNMLDLDSGRMAVHRHDGLNPFCISHNDIRSMHVDRAGNLWMGTLGNELNKINGRMMLFRLYQAGDNPRVNLNDNSVWAVIKDRHGDLWVGTDNGLNHYDSQRGTFIYHTHSPGTGRGLAHHMVMSLLEDHLGDIWIGTSGGVNRYHRDSGRIERIVMRGPHAAGIAGRQVDSLHEDGRGFIWLGGGTGLYRMDPRTHHVMAFPLGGSDPRHRRGDAVMAIAGDGGDGLYVGTPRGLYVLNDCTGVAGSAADAGNARHLLAGIAVNCLFPEDYEHLWVGTNRGVRIINPVTGRAYSVPAFRGPVLPAVTGIVRNNTGRVFLMSTKGILVCHPRRNEILPFPLFSRSSNWGYNLSAVFADRDGAIFAGTRNGLLEFHPDRLRGNHLPPRVALTGFKLLGKEVRPGVGSVLEKDIARADRIVLRHWQNSMAFEFSVLDLTVPELNRYQCRLIPREQEWRTVSSRDRRAVYNDLPAGRYRFSVRGASSDGVWCESPAGISITIRPPFWLAWWFWGIGAVILFAMALFFFRTRIARQAEQVYSDAHLERFCHRFKITRREKEILQLLLKGMKRREIEDTLFISGHTVKNHIYRIYKKLGISRQSDLFNMFRNSSKMTDKKNP